MSEHERGATRLFDPYEPGEVQLGGKAQAKTSFGEPSEGLFSGPGDGTIGGVGEKLLEQRHQQRERDEDNRLSDEEGGFTAGTNSDIAGQPPRGQGAQVAGTAGGIGADEVGGMGSGTGRRNDDKAR